jgi:hypothetical protein
MPVAVNHLIKRLNDKLSSFEMLCLVNDSGRVISNMSPLYNPRSVAITDNYKTFWSFSINNDMGLDEFEALVERIKRIRDHYGLTEYRIVKIRYTVTQTTERVHF